MSAVTGNATQHFGYYDQCVFSFMPDYPMNASKNASTNASSIPSRRALRNASGNASRNPSREGFPGMSPSLSTPSGAQEERNINKPTIIMNFQATMHYLIKLRTGSKKREPITKALFNQLDIELKHLPIIQLAWRRQRKN